MLPNTDRSCVEKMEKNRMLSVTGINQAMKAQKISLVPRLIKHFILQIIIYPKLMKSRDLKNKTGRATRIPTTKKQHKK